MNRLRSRGTLNLKSAVDHGDLTQSLGHKRLRKPLTEPMRVRLRVFRSLSAPTSCASSSIPTAALRLKRAGPPAEPENEQALGEQEKDKARPTVGPIQRGSEEFQRAGDDLAQGQNPTGLAM